MSTAVRPLRIGIDSALLNDAGVDAIIDGRVMVDSQRGEGATLPFVSLGTPTEGPFDVFNGRGNDGTRILHLYGADEDVVEQLYGEVKRTLEAGVTVDDHTVLSLTCRLLSISHDEPSGGSHGVVRVSALTQAVA